MDKKSVTLLTEALNVLSQGFQALPEFDSVMDLEALASVMQQVAEKMQNNYPYHHPLYAGQMLKPPHPIARLAYMLAMWINPNNHALDGGRASSAMEKEAVAAIASMFGWETHLGHLTSGGTVANLEALWVAGQLHPDKKIVASTQAHYTHQRICGVLKIPFESIPSDRRACMDVAVLEKKLQAGDIGTVVVTLGTTATGSVDPLPAILDLQEKYEFRIHVDAAYGGYFILANNLGHAARETFDAIYQSDSIAIDPHKHGLQPYGCGCVLFRNPSVGTLYKHDSPYTYFTSSELHLGEISLECSRAGAAAVGLWATQKLLPMTKDGQFAHDLSKCRQAALQFYAYLQNDKRFIVPFEPQLDIVIWIPKAKTTTEASSLSKAIFDESAIHQLHLALVNLPRSLFEGLDMAWDQPYVTGLRSCLMKPEHLAWLDRIWAILDEVTTAVSRE